jgi:hypothetical protein
MALDTESRENSRLFMLVNKFQGVYLDSTLLLLTDVQVNIALLDVNICTKVN